MKHLPPPPRGRHAVPATPLPPPPDRVHPAHHHFIEKPSVAPVLLDIQSDEFRSGHMLPRFPPLDALPRIATEPEARSGEAPPHRGRGHDRRLLHLIALGAVVVFFAAIEIDRQTHSAAAGASRVVGEELAQTFDWRTVFPIQATTVSPRTTTAPSTPAVTAPPPAIVPTIVITAAPDVPSAAPELAAPVVSAKPAPADASNVAAPTPPPKPKPAGSDVPAPAEPQPDPTHGVESPGF